MTDPFSKRLMVAVLALLRKQDRRAASLHVRWKKLIAAAYAARQWLIAVTVVVLALGIGANPPSSVIQAQDGGTGTGEAGLLSYQLVVPPDLSPMCAGGTKSIEVPLVAWVRIPGDPNIGRLGPYIARLSASTANPAILTAYPAQMPTWGIPTQAWLVFNGHSVGRTVVTLAVGLRGAPFPDPNGIHFSLPIEVIECWYKVEAFSTWVTSIDGANVLLTAEFHDVMLHTTNGHTFTAVGYPTSVQWTAIVNRIKGCLADRQAFSPPAPSATILGEISGDELILTVTINELEYGGILFDCPGHVLTRGRIRSCDDYRDGICDLKMPNPTFSPESRTIRFPVRGGTITVRHPLTHSQGSAQGRQTITLSPGLH